MAGDAIRAILQKADSSKERIFSDDVGAFDWQFKKSAAV